MRCAVGLLDLSNPFASLQGVFDGTEGSSGYVHVAELDGVLALRQFSRFLAIVHVQIDPPTYSPSPPMIAASGNLDRLALAGFAALHERHAHLSVGVARSQGLLLRIPDPQFSQASLRSGAVVRMTRTTTPMKEKRSAPALCKTFT